MVAVALAVAVSVVSALVAAFAVVAAVAVVADVSAAFVGFWLTALVFVAVVAVADPVEGA